MFSSENFLKKLVDIIKTNLNNDITYATWFEKLKLKEIKNKTAVFEVPVIYMKNTIEERYDDLLCDWIKEASDGVLSDYEIILGEKKKSSFLESFNKIDFQSNINKKYTFENFVIGASNSFSQS